MGRVVVHNGGAGDMPFVVGTYQGDGAESQFIPLGFTPGAVILWDQDGGQKDYQGGGNYRQYRGGMAFPGNPCKTHVLGGSMYPIVSIEDGGFRVYFDSGNSVGTNEKSTASPFVYYYMAFRP